MVALTASTDRSKRIAPKTVNNARTWLSVALGEAVRKKLLPSNPCEWVKPLPVEKVEIDYLKLAEIDHYLQACPDYYRALAEFLIGSGARISEAIRARWDDLEPDRSLVRSTDSARAAPITARDQGQTVSPGADRAWPGRDAARPAGASPGERYPRRRLGVRLPAGQAWPLREPHRARRPGRQHGARVARGGAGRRRAARYAAALPAPHRRGGVAGDRARADSAQRHSGTPRSPLPRSTMRTWRSGSWPTPGHRAKILRGRSGQFPQRRDMR